VSVVACDEDLHQQDGNEQQGQDEMEREARWQLVRYALDPQGHEVKEHTEEQDECISPKAMGPHEAPMGHVVFGSTGSMQHHPDVGAGEKHEERTQGRAQ